MVHIHKKHLPLPNKTPCNCNTCVFLYKLVAKEKKEYFKQLPFPFSVSHSESEPPTLDDA